MNIAPAGSGTCVQAEPFALRVTDDSMAPEFPAGCVVVVDPTGHVRDGAFVVVDVAEGLCLRRLHLGAGEVRLCALSVGVADIRPDDTPACIVGVVVQRAGRRRREHKRYD